MRRFHAALAAALLLALTTVARPAPLPPAADCINAFNTVDSWIRQWAVAHEPQPIDPEGAVAACVTLRLSGQVLGRATAVASDRTAVWSAARDAFVQAVESLPVERDALRARRLEEITPRITLDLQLAGEFIPMLIEDDRALALALQLPIGVEGLALRLNDRTEAFFPGAMLSTGIAPAEALRVLCARFDLPPKPLQDLINQHGLRLYRFPVRHLVAPREQAPPQFVYRGGRIVAPAEVTGPVLREAADLIAHHLMTHAWPGNEPHGITGDYHALTDRYDPLIAPPIQQAACALALARYAEIPGISTANRERARRFALAILHASLTTTLDESSPTDSPLDAAMWLIAYETVPIGPETAPQFIAQRVAALERVRATVRVSEGRAEWSPDAPAQGRGLIAHALAVAATRDASLSETAHATVRLVFRETDPAALVAEMPWLGWAELALADKAQPIPAAEALIDMRQRALRFQLKEDDLGTGSADMLGGIVFTRSTTPLPTWHSLRPLAFLATMLADPRLTADETLVSEIANVRPAYRHLLQLMIGEPLTHMHRDRDRSLGAVRPAVWDQTASLDASAMALLSISEFLRAIAIEKRGDLPPPR